MNKEKKRNRVGLWFLSVAMIILIITAINMFIENRPKGESKLFANIAVDGRINHAEYTHHFLDKKTKYGLYWRIEGKNIYFGMHSPQKGWIAIGLGAKNAMEGADIYIAYVKNGKTYINEEYGNSPYSHIPIKNTGAKSIIKSYAGRLTANGATIEFERPLKGDSKYIKTIDKNPMNVIFAYSNSADFTTYHGPGSRGAAEINFFKSNTKSKKSGSGMWVTDIASYQIAGIVWGVLFLMAAFIAFITEWIEYVSTEPVFIKKENVGLGPFIMLTILGIVDIILVIAFIEELFSKTTPTVRGLTASVIFFILSIMVVLYRRYYIDERIIIHELDDKLPW